MQSLTVRKTGAKCSAYIEIPSSKSYIHRFLLSALFADGESTLENVTLSEDVLATLSCIETLGAKTELSDDRRSIKVHGGIKKSDFASLYCNQSASTLRFIIPAALFLCARAEFKGVKSLMKRPLEPYFKLFRENGIDFSFADECTLRASGYFKHNRFEIDGGVSSQFVTGLLFVLPLSESDSTIIINGELQSKPYVDITLEVLEKSGIVIENRDYKSFFIRGNQRFKPCRFVAQGDYSQAAFFLAAGAISGEIEIGNMKSKSNQGDFEIVRLIRRMGAEIKETEGGFAVKKASLHSLGRINASDFPDIVPPLALLCSLCDGRTVIEGIERLRFKECDRIAATADMLSRLGADIRENGDTLVIDGKRTLKGGTADSFDDHRIAMTAAVAALACDGSVCIKEPMCINKSYPDFYNDLLLTGGVEYEWNLGK